MKAGFVSIIGLPNAGKSTLFNALLQQKLSITNPKVQTTRHQIKAFLSVPEKYQMVFLDTPGLLTPKYLLHQKMEQSIHLAIADADVVIFLADLKMDPADIKSYINNLKINCPIIVAINKIDKLKAAPSELVAINFFENKQVKNCLPISALNNVGVRDLIDLVYLYLPESPPFYDMDELTDMPDKFFVEEIIREKIFTLFENEIPYNTTVHINEFKERNTKTFIQADIFVIRESQKAILLGQGGQKINRLGSIARTEIEQFLGYPVYLQLFVKVKPKWRTNEAMLKQLGY